MNGEYILLTINIAALIVNIYWFVTNRKHPRLSK